MADALASYRIDRWRVQLNAYNLFDENYVDSGSPTGTRTVLLGEPFTMKLSVGFAL
ncbi:MULTISPECIES: TonB-dependent receptor [Brevundimonas]|uniref:TonB-dependent receptor n=1 Tax=Brevundimonas nasdae TaxID=172043 RepID=A0ABX8TQL8_9CAUL|nr:TonB-dependent receptor [Brevundimonas nasdae]QYC11909.1 TonB-dependent receptor [Brevundimonas nasdae]QYC14694.1 TonB-dependent receptor [Brevundimonas nasdae]